MRCRVVGAVLASLFSLDLREREREQLAQDREQAQLDREREREDAQRERDAERC